MRAYIVLTGWMLAAHVVTLSIDRLHNHYPSSWDLVVLIVIVALFLDARVRGCRPVVVQQVTGLGLRSMHSGQSPADLAQRAGMK